MSYFGINLTKHKQDLHAKNYKNIHEKFKSLSRETQFFSRTRRLSMVKISIFSPHIDL